LVAGTSPDAIWQKRQSATDEILTSGSQRAIVFPGVLPAAPAPHTPARRTAHRRRVHII
jgi:hypothetical protein